MALALGLRQGEALGLRLGRGGFHGRNPHVRAALQWVGKQWQLVEPKSERSRRAVALPRVAIVALRAHRVHQKKERLLAGSDWRETGWCSRRATGGALDPINLTKGLQAIIEASRTSGDAIPRSAAYGRDVLARPRRRSTDDHGDARALSNQPDVEYIFPRPSCPATRCGDQDEPALGQTGMKWRFPCDGRQRGRQTAIRAKPLRSFS